MQHRAPLAIRAPSTPIRRNYFYRTNSGEWKWKESSRDEKINLPLLLNKLREKRLNNLPIHYDYKKSEVSRVI
jgi:hypothetical protein